MDAALAPSHLGADAPGHQTTPSSASSSPLLSVVLSVLPRSLVLLRGTVAAVWLATTLDTHYTLDTFPDCFRDSYSWLCMALRLMVELLPDWRCRPAMLRLLVRTAAARAHGYSTLALLLDGAPDYEEEARDTEQASNDMHTSLNDSHQHGPTAEGSAACGMKKVLNLPPLAQQLAPLALDLMWGMEGMLQTMQQHWHMFPPVACVEMISRMSSLFRACCVSLILFGHVIEVLAEPAAVGPAGLAAQPASWLPCGNSLVEGWCGQLLARVCQLFCINSPDHKRIDRCRALAGSHTYLFRVQEQASPRMSPEAERLLACLTLVLTVALPLDTWLAVSPSLPAAGAKVLEQASAIHDLLTRVEAEQVWSWQALAAGTPAEASLASVLQGAANKLQLPHLVAPAPQGWQPGRLTLDRGRGPPELMRLCLPSLRPFHLLDPLSAGNTAAAELCTLLLTDQEVLDVVLALHDIRLAQLWNLLPITRGRLPSPVSSEAFARRLNQRQRSASGDQLNLFVEALGRDTIVEGDPLLGVWESIHRAIQLVLAALQSLPIHPHPQHPDPAATTHTSATPLLPPGYHRCSICLLLSLSLALRLSQLCIVQVNGVDQLLARLHGTLPGLLLGLSTAVSVMQAAGHPEAEVHRLLLLRCILHLGPLQQCSMDETDWANSKDMVDQLNAEPITSCPDHLAHLLASSPAVTGWPGHPPAKLSSEHSSTAAASSGGGLTSSRSSSNSCQDKGGMKGKSTEQGGKGSSTACPKDLAVVNSFAHVAQALCAVLGRQEEGLIMDQLISTCKAEGEESLKELRANASCLASAALKVMVHEYYCLNYTARIVGTASAASHLGAVAPGRHTTSSSASSSPLFSVVLSVLPRCLVLLRGTVAAVRLAATLGTHLTLDTFPDCFRDSYSWLCMLLRLMVELWPDWRCRPAMLRLLVRTAAAGAHGYSTLTLLLDGAPDCEAETHLLSGLKRTPELKARTPELEALLTDTLEGVCSAWVFLLVPYSEIEQASINMRIRLNESHQQVQDAKGSAACRRKEVHDTPEGVSHQQGQYAKAGAACGTEKVLNLPPSAQQLAPLALDLVWGMEGMLQMMKRHWHMFWSVACVKKSSTMSSLFRSCCTSLFLFGHVIKVLAKPAAVGPSGLAAQPASWLPCGNSLVEGWCGQLLARVCQLLCINSPDLEGPMDHTRMMACRGLAGSHTFLLQGQEQALPRMSPEAERLLSCLMLVLTVALPLDTWLAVSPSLPADEAEIIEQAIRNSLTRVEPEQVWSWQALAAGTPAEASLASVLQGAANKLQLPHLVAPAPQGWQPGRLTLDRGRGPSELMALCFPLRVQDMRGTPS
ncbi:hypothetical protein QJQ45_005008 [Haematococcus lacustris]|nr:hypothetical protein QJQ45_005008 [Haematococcus lacustris]